MCFPGNVTGETYARELPRRAAEELGGLDVLVVNAGHQKSFENFEEITTSDFDGNGIEITFETPWRGTLGDPESGSHATTADGRVHRWRVGVLWVALLLVAASWTNSEYVMRAGLGAVEAGAGAACSTGSSGCWLCGRSRSATVASPASGRS